MNPNENWKEIKGYTNYECSDLGHVKNKATGRLLKPRFDKDGYEKVILYSNSVPKEFRLHRLIAEAFVENSDPETNKLVNHKNEIKNDNRAENLEWCSPRYNDNYGERNRKIGEAHILNKTHGEMSVSQYDRKTGEFIAEYSSLREAERATGTFHSNISRSAKRAEEGKRLTGKYIWKLNKNKID